MAILQKGNKLGVCVHHSVYTPANNLAELKVQASLFNTWHKAKSWAEDTKTPSAYPYISYHYLMATNGEMLKVTDEKYVKYHAGDNFRKDLSFNLHGIAVCLTGNYENDKPTDAQMKALVEFIRDVEKRYDINARVRGHKETSADATACPGKNIGTSASGWLKSVIANVNNPNYPPPPTPPTPPPPTPPAPSPAPTDPTIELKKRITTLEGEISGLRTALSDSEDRNTVLEGKIKDKDVKIKKLDAEIANSKEDYEKLEQTCNSLKKYQQLYIDATKDLNELRNSRFMWIVKWLERIFPKKPKKD